MVLALANLPVFPFLNFFLSLLVSNREKVHMPFYYRAYLRRLVLMSFLCYAAGDRVATNAWKSRPETPASAPSLCFSS